MKKLNLNKKIIIRLNDYEMGNVKAGSVLVSGCTACLTLRPACKTGGVYTCYTESPPCA